MTPKAQGDTELRQAYKRSAAGWGMSAAQAYRQAATLCGIALLGLLLITAGVLLLLPPYSSDRLVIGLLAIVGGGVFTLLTTRPVPALLAAWRKGGVPTEAPEQIEGRVTTVSAAAGVFGDRSDRVIIRLEPSTGHSKLLVIGFDSPGLGVGASVRVRYLPANEQVIDVSPAGTRG